MAYVCALAGGKGGVGRTTTAVNLGAAMSAAGHDVVVVDADLGMANLGAMLGVDHDPSLHGVLSGDGVSVADATTAGPEGLTVLPGAPTLDAFAAAETAQLRGVVDELRERHDVVVLDTGAGLSHEATLPLGLADGVVVVTTPDPVAVADAEKTARLADRVGGAVVGGVVTRTEADTDLEALDEETAFTVLGGVPLDREAVGEEPLVETAPESPAAEAYRDLAEALALVFFEDVEPVDARLSTNFAADDEDEDGDEGDGGIGWGGIMTG
jgi:septum site-determining protein MinD